MTFFMEGFRWERPWRSVLPITKEAVVNLLPVRTSVRRWRVPAKKYFWWMEIFSWICRWHSFRRTGYFNMHRERIISITQLGNRRIWQIISCIHRTKIWICFHLPHWWVQSNMSFLQSGRENLSCENACRRSKIPKFMTTSWSMHRRHLAVG